ncbi:glycosyltransferase family 2 protein [Cobetia amphilecti]|uniref:glycosyltransferase family 2 protein n=1 Tax=Cobetia amphilecti TaxID=1055104 RepID=UPI000A07932C|nr:glycosyltransferase family A protein [Cobetia amphilecti]
MDKFSLVSVIVPCYNRENIIIETLDSVYNQTYKNIELIVIDDGSVDDSLSVIKSWASKFEKNDFFKVKILEQVNSGAQVARNLGLENSNGMYIQYLDSDDILHNKKIELQVKEFLKNPTIDFVHSEYQFFSVTLDNCVGNIKSGEYSLVKHISLKSPIQTSIGLYKRKICEIIGPWDVELKIGQDIDYNSRLIIATQNSYFLKGCFTYLRKHSGERVSQKKDLAPLFNTYSKQCKIVSGLDDLNITKSLEPWFEYAFSTIAIRAAINKDSFFFDNSLREINKYCKKNSYNRRVFYYILKPLPLRIRSYVAKWLLAMSSVRRLKLFKSITYK